MLGGPCRRLCLLLLLIPCTSPSAPERVGTSRQLDYHRLCAAKERGGCSHWEGLSCGEVDAILLNVRRYEQQIQTDDAQPVASPVTSRAPSSLAAVQAGASPRIHLRPPAPAGKETYSHSTAPAASPASRRMDILKGGVKGGVGQQGASAAKADSHGARNQLPAPHTQALAQEQQARKRQSARPSSAAAKPEGNMAASSGSHKVASFPVVDKDGHTKYRLGDGLEPSPAFPRGRSTSLLLFQPHSCLSPLLLLQSCWVFLSCVACCRSAQCVR